MSTIDPQQNDAGLLINGGIVPLHTPLAYTPNVGEMALMINGAVHPLMPLYSDPPQNDDAPRIVINNENKFVFPSVSDYDASTYGVHLPRVSVTPNTTENGSVYILDTPLDEDTSEADKANPNYIPNPGISILSPAHLFYPTADQDAVPLDYDCAGWEWLAYATWTKTGTSAGELDLSIANPVTGMSIKYTTGSGEPGTTYSTPIAITADQTIRFRLYNGKRTSPIYTHHVVFDAGVAPETSITKHPIITVSEDPGGTSLNGLSNHPNVHYRYTYRSGGAAVWPKPQTLDSAAVGTQYMGPFLPVDDLSGTTISGTLRMVAYKYGHQYTTCDQAISVKIGKLSAEWDGTDTLTLSCATDGATIKYRLNATGVYLTYSTPLTITETTGIEFYATKTSMISSDIFIFSVTFDEEDNPEEAWSNSWWSSPNKDALGVSFTPSNWTPSVIKSVLHFPKRPKYYITPDGTGDGLSPSTPSNMLTIIGSSTAAGLATGDDIVWASEGVYQFSTFNNYWRVRDNVVLVGGFSTDFTERDVLNRKSIVKPGVLSEEGAVPWGNYDESIEGWHDYFIYDATYVSSYSIHGGTGVVDGWWSEGEDNVGIYYDAFHPNYNWPDESGYRTYPYSTESTIHFGGGGTFYNCHVNYTKTVTGPTSTPSRFSGELWGSGYDNDTDRNPTYIQLMAPDVITILHAFDAGTCYGCSLTVDIQTDNGAVGASDNSNYYVEDILPPGLFSGFHSSGGYGHGRAVIINAWGDVQKWCATSINVVVGNGGNGGDATADGDGGDPSTYQATNYANAGEGGVAICSITIGGSATFDAHHNTLDVDVAVGNSGDGGGGYSYLPTYGTFNDADSTSGNSGSVSGTITYGGVVGSNSTASVDLSAGSVGDGGTGTLYFDGEYVNSFGIHGDGPVASVTSSEKGHYSTESITCACGDSGECGSSEFVETLVPRGIPSARIDVSGSYRYQWTQNYFASIGTGTQVGIETDQEGGCYIEASGMMYPAEFTAETSTAAGTLDDFAYNGVAIPPTTTERFDDERHLSTITITEDSTYDLVAGGNYDRVTATDPSLTDFYSGTENGDNVPIDGYDTGGGGDTLGRWWETP